MKFLKITVLCTIIFCAGLRTILCAQSKNNSAINEAGRKIEDGFLNNNNDTLAKGYLELGENYYQKGELKKSEEQFKMAKSLYEKTGNASGIAESSRALARVQEDLHLSKAALSNYNTAIQNNLKTGDNNSLYLNGNDIKRLSKPDSFIIQEKLLLSNINLGLKNKDSFEIANSYNRMADINLKAGSTQTAIGSLTNAYNYSLNVPVQARRINQQIANVYVQNKDFEKAIETKNAILNEPFINKSTQAKASEITSLADIYLIKKDDSTAIMLLKESYELSVKNGHTIEARNCIERLDSIYQARGQKDKSLLLYKNFLSLLPDVIINDSSLADNKIVEATENKIKKLENEKTLKDELINKKNTFNYWLTGSVIALALLLASILFVVKKLKTKNKKIALQSLRREMNPHFIFNSLNSINQFIASNNELAANQYLTKFSMLMRRVMENSKNDFVLFSKEVELLQNYLELEQSRFPDKFKFTIHIDDALVAEEQLFIPGMLIQPHLENAIWHGLRYMELQGLLTLSFRKKENSIIVEIEDNGIGIAASKQLKTVNQKQHSGRGISNTLERINILNELYHHHISCTVEDKAAPGNGVRVTMTVPILKNMQDEN